MASNWHLSHLAALTSTTACHVVLPLCNEYFRISAMNGSAAGLSVREFALYDIEQYTTLPLCIEGD